MRLWQRVGLSCLLCLSMHALAFADTETSTTPKKPPVSTSVTPKHPTTAHTTKHAAGSTAQKTKSKSRARKGSKSSRKRGQQVIDGERARAIQQALIREHYMEGQPSGKWDSATQEAMQRYQAAQGWQAKTTPDSRALIKLGLGPSKAHLLNPESAMTAADPKPASKPNSAAADPSPSDRPQQ